MDTVKRPAVQLAMPLGIEMRIKLVLKEKMPQLISAIEDLALEWLADEAPEVFQLATDARLQLYAGVRILNLDFMARVEPPPEVVG